MFLQKQRVNLKVPAMSLSYKLGMKRPPPGATARVDINEAAVLLNEYKKAEFWSRVAVGDPEKCWPWLAAKLPNGYGMSSVRWHTMLAHRLAYVLGVGPIPPGLVVRHLCDNRICCNPAHLAVGTYADNEADKKRRRQ